jgi:hypothetical protein
METKTYSGSLKGTDHLGHLAHMEEYENVLKEIRCEDMDWIQVA